MGLDYGLRPTPSPPQLILAVRFCVFFFLFLILSWTKEILFIPLLYSFSLFFSPFCLVSLVSRPFCPGHLGRSVGLYQLISPGQLISAYRSLSLFISPYRGLSWLIGIERTNFRSM